jgi:hypothetical protein
MRPLLLAAVLAAFFGLSAADASPSSSEPVPAKPPPEEPGFTPPPPEPRLEGDTVDNAIVIPTIPLTVTGNSCEYTNDYDEVCPYQGSFAPDVVYSYVPPADGALVVSLCTSAYDTKVYVWEDAPYELVACNDDECGPDGFRSRLYAVPILAGRTYYIVVDGYGGECGEYEMELDLYIQEQVPCPPGAVLEGEPDCHDGYEDTFNPGCGGVPDPIFTDLYGTPGGQIFYVCGKSGTFLVGGVNFRDTDWYVFQVAEEAEITFGCTAEFPVLNVVMDASTGCDDLTILETATGGPLEYFTITRTYPPGEYWYWVGPEIFTGITCGDDYVFSVEGLVASPISVNRVSWGAVKALYR